MDREKVIKSLKWFRDRDKWREGIMIHDDHAEVRKRICDDALALLKEDQKLLDLQHGALRGSSDMVELLFNKLDDQPQIVRCKDCKHILPKGFYHKHSRKVTDDWFCADGERRTDEQDRRVRVK